MTKDQFSKVMLATFSSYGRDLSTDSGQRLTAAWWDAFGTEDSSSFEVAMRQHMNNKSSQPKVSEIKQLLKRTRNTDSTQACSECGAITERKTMLAVGDINSPMRLVCFDCWEDLALNTRRLQGSDALTSEDLDYLRTLSVAHNVKMVDMILHLRASISTNTPLGEYLAGLPRNYQEFVDQGYMEKMKGIGNA